MKIKLSIILIIAFPIFIRSYSSAQGIVASYNKNMVDSLMQTIDTTAKLYMIQCGDTVQINGKTSSWHYWYMAPPKLPDYPISYYFHATFDSVVYDSSSSIFNPSQLGWVYISEPWFDSDSAMILAEKQGGENFRINNPNYIIAASLLAPMNPYYLFKPYWRIWYVSPDSVLRFNFDATDIRKYDPIYPIDFILNQNYPNPFNLKTTITFSLAHSARVNLSVFNILGQQICSLLSQRLSVGLFKSEWDGTNQASGVYYYRLQVDDKVFCKKMILLK